MALFKILKGAGNLPTTKNEGWAYVKKTGSDTANFYVDYDANTRVQIGKYAENGIYYIDGTGTTAGTWLGSHSGITSYYNGLAILYRPSVAGASTTTLNINGLGARTCYVRGSTKLTTHYAIDSLIILTYDTSLNSGGGGWEAHSYYDSNTYCASMCTTAANTAAKTASHTYYALRTGNWTLLTIRYSNTYQGKLTLNINGSGAKDLWINGAVSSSSNYTLPAGTYLVYYDGTKYLLYTNNYIPAHVTEADHATNADHATSADTATKATTANSATNANHATTADSATKATTADSATKADTATTATSAGAFISAATVKLTGDVTGETSSTKGWTIATTLNNTTVTAGTYGPTANVSPKHGGTFSVPSFVVNSQGRLTGAYSRTITLPTYSVFGGASASNDGSTGLVPAPTKGQEGYYLRGDGKWFNLTEMDSTVQNNFQALKDAWVSADTSLKNTLTTLINGKAPTSHASSSSAYGLSTDTLYGHAMASSTTPKASAATAVVGSETAKFARGDHVHPLTVANSWSAGSGAGPKIITTINGVAGAGAALPTATASASGAVIVGDQTFGGIKRFSQIAVNNTYHLGSFYNYTSGCLIDIGPMANNTMVAIHITGNSYTSSDVPINSLYQVYDYGSGTTMNYSGMSIGQDLGAMKVYRYNNRLYAHIAQKTTYSTLNITLYTNQSGLTPTVTNAAAPTSGYTDLVTITPSRPPLANSGVTNGSYGPSAGDSLTAAESFTVPYITVDAKGRVTAASNQTFSFVAPASGSWFNNGFVKIGTDGVAEHGRYIDFHATSGSTNDYDVRIDAGTGAKKNTLYLPEVTGQFVTHTNDTKVGAADRPVYIEASGAATATTYRMAGTNTAATTARAITENLETGIWYVNGTSDILGQSDGVAFVNQYNSSWISEIYQDYRTGQIAVRGKNNGTWQAWRKILDTSNYSTTLDTRYVTLATAQTISGVKTFTAIPQFQTTNYTSTPLVIYDDGTAYGHTLLLGAGGTTYVGAGESASGLYSKLAVKSTENLILGADGAIQFYPNADSATTTSGITLDTSKNFYPQTTNTGSIGTSSYKWKSMYATTFYGALSGHATSAGYLTTSITFTPADSALTPENVRALIGSGSQIRRGSWSYAGNGYIASGTTAASACPFGAIDLAGTTVIQANNSSSAFTQIYITPPTASTSGAIKGEMLYYVDNGSSYTPTWYRVLTDKNYTAYAADRTAITNITRDGTTFTATRANGTTFTFTQQDYYHTRIYSSGLQISTGTGVSAMYVPYATGSQAGAVSTAAQTFGGDKTFNNAIYISASGIIQIENDTSNWRQAITWRNQTKEAGSYLAGIGRHNTGGDSTYPGTISIIPYATDDSPWGRTNGLNISKHDMYFEGKRFIYDGNLVIPTSQPATLIAGMIWVTT